MQTLDYSDRYIEERPFGSAAKEIRVVEGSMDKPQLTQKQEGDRMDEVLM